MRNTEKCDGDGSCGGGDYRKTEMDPVFGGECDRFIGQAHLARCGRHHARRHIGEVDHARLQQEHDRSKRHIRYGDEPYGLPNEARLGIARRVNPESLICGSISTVA